MSANEIHVDDIGTLFTLTLRDGDDPVDISAATEKVIIFQKPNNSRVEKTATFFSDGTDGKIKYTTISGDLTPAGLWRLQARVVVPAGTWHSDVYNFIVHPNI